MLWSECCGGGSSPPSSNTILGSVVNCTGNASIENGQLDIFSLRTERYWQSRIGHLVARLDSIALQQSLSMCLVTTAVTCLSSPGRCVSEPFIVSEAWWVNLFGYMIPKYAPSAAYRHLEVLLGWVESLSSIAPFTSDTDPQQSPNAFSNDTSAWTAQQGGVKGEESIIELTDKWQY